MISDENVSRLVEGQPIFIQDGAHGIHTGIDIRIEYSDKIEELAEMMKAAEQRLKENGDG